MRIFTDTNVLVSAFMTRGLCADLNLARINLRERAAEEAGGRRGADAHRILDQHGIVARRRDDLGRDEAELEICVVCVSAPVPPVKPR